MVSPYLEEFVHDVTLTLLELWLGLSESSPNGLLIRYENNMITDDNNYFRVSE
jgi:hypothetical protein